MPEWGGEGLAEESPNKKHLEILFSGEDAAARGLWQEVNHVACPAQLSGAIGSETLPRTWCRRGQVILRGSWGKTGIC